MPLDMTAAAAYVQGQQQQADSGGGKRRDIINYKFRPGQNRGRLLSPWPGSGELATHIWHHTGCPPGKTHFFCWENMYPGRGIECPICTVCKQLRAKLGNDSGIWKQEAWDSPRTNWIDRQPLHPQTFQPLPLELNPGPQIIDLDIHTFNYLMSTAVQTGCDLTSTDLGYDIIINYDPNAAKKKDAYQTAIMPGAAQPLAPNPELAKLWLDNMYDLRSIVKMPNWQDPKGRAEWEKICSSAREIERMYLQGAGATQGFTPGQQAPVGQFPQQAQMPQFTQPTAGQPTAPPPQFAQPGMMGAPGAVPFGGPPMAPPPAPPAAPMPPSAPPMPPPPMAAAPAPPAPAPPYAAPTGPPAPPAMPQSASAGFAPPPMPPAMPQQPAAPPVDNRPPWEQQGQPTAPAAPNVMGTPVPTTFPQQPPNMGVPAPAPPAPAPPMPPAPMPPPAPPAPGPSMVNTSADGKPVCFGHSRLDNTVEYNATGQGPVKGGFSDDPAEVGYRCMMCPQQLECQSKAQATFPEHYAKNGNAYVMPKTA